MWNPFIISDDFLLRQTDRLVLFIWNRLEIKVYSIMRMAVFLWIGLDIATDHRWWNVALDGFLLLFNFFALSRAEKMSDDTANLVRLQMRYNPIMRFFRIIDVWKLPVVLLAFWAEALPKAITDTVILILGAGFLYLWSAFIPTKPPRRKKVEIKLGRLAPLPIRT